VLFRAIPQRDVKPLAKQLIARFGSFAEVIAAPPQRLAEIKGLGEAAITEFKIVHAAASRLARGQLSAGRALVMVERTRLLPHGAGVRRKEHPRALRRRNQPSPTRCSRSAPSITPVYPREVVKRALELSATALF
jgi:DNA repair protein RadC